MPERPDTGRPTARALAARGDAPNPGFPGPPAVARQLIHSPRDNWRSAMLNTFLLTDNRRRLLLLTILMFAALC